MPDKAAPVKSEAGSRIGELLRCLESMDYYTKPTSQPASQRALPPPLQPASQPASSSFEISKPALLPKPEIRSGSSIWRNGYTLEYWLKDSRQKPYKIRLAMEEMKTCQEIRNILSIIQFLNSLSVSPIKDFAFYSRCNDSCRYEEFEHEVIFDSAGGSDKFEVLVHEIGHGLYAKRFRKDKDWDPIHMLSLGWSNYKIFNYKFHPAREPSESFAFSILAYFYQADSFKIRIQDPKTPEKMRFFGKLVWCFMRDRVFEGKVFTKDGRDPFAGETVTALSTILNKKWNEDSSASQIDHPIKNLVSALIEFLSSEGKKNSLNVDLVDALFAIGYIGPAAKDAVPELIKILEKNAYWLTNFLAIIALGKIGSASKDAIPALIARLADRHGVYFEGKDTSLQAVASEALAKIGVAAVPKLITALGDADQCVRENATIALSNIGKRAVPRLIAALRDKNPLVRIHAACALCKIGYAAKRVVPYLIEALRDRRRDVMLEAIKALGECGPDAKIAIRYLILVLGNHREESIVNAVIKSLGKIGKDAVPHLIKALKDKRVLVQIGAANALGMMGRFAANAIPALTANLSHKNPHVRKAVEDALDRIR